MDPGQTQDWLPTGVICLPAWLEVRFKVTLAATTGLFTLTGDYLPVTVFGDRSGSDRRDTRRLKILFNAIAAGADRRPRFFPAW